MTIKINNKEVIFKTFPNREIYLNNCEYIIGSLREDYVEIFWRFENNNSLIELMLFMKHLNSMREKALTRLVIAYMPYSRMDRVKNRSDLFTLKYIAEFINNLNFSEVIICDHHSDVTLALINNSKPIYPLLNMALDFCREQKNTVICYPDQGAFKKYYPMFSCLRSEPVIAIKHRNLDGALSLLSITGDINNKNILIVDDICSYGGTFLLVADELKKRGAKEIFLFVTHCEQSIFSGKLFETDTIDEIYTTDSLGISKNKDEFLKPIYNKLKIFNLEKLINEQYKPNVIM